MSEVTSWSVNSKILYEAEAALPGNRVYWHIDRPLKNDEKFYLKM